MKAKLLIGMLLLAYVSIFTPSAHATLIGDTIEASGALLYPSSATIGDGVEFSGVLGFLNMDFGASTLTITPAINTIGWYWYGTYTFSGFDDLITGLNILSNTGFTGDVISNFSFTDHSISLNFDTGSAENGSELVFDIDTAPVPEPSTFLLLGAGLIGAALMKRKRTA